MPPSGREYRIGEFAAMVGMAPSKIRFYEKAGLFPAHRHENGYRYFTSHDAFRSNAFRVLLQYGFTVEQAIEMLDTEQGTAAFARTLAARRQELHDEIDLARYRLSRVDAAIDLLQGPPYATCSIVEAPDQLFVRASRGTDFSVAVEHSREIAFFYRLLNVTACARIIARDELARGTGCVDPSYIITMPAHEAHRLKGCDLRKIERLELGRCLQFRRCVAREEGLCAASFAPMHAYMRDNGLRLRGDVLLLPMFFNLDGQGRDIETLLAPVEPAA